MSWLNPSTIRQTVCDPGAKVSGFIQESGDLGQIALSAWNAVDPFHCYYDDDCNPDEYLGYARRFVQGAGSIALAEDWSDHPDLVEELVRRSFRPEQVCVHIRLGRPWATTEDVKAIARLITEQAQQSGGIAKLATKS